MQDYYSRFPGRPIVDAHQDWIIISGSQTEDETTLRFYRQLITNDLEDVPIEVIYIKLLT